MKQNNPLSEIVEDLTESYISDTSSNYRKQRGQFFTPLAVGRYMVNQIVFNTKKSKLNILDPGAGIGVFETLICERLKTIDTPIRVNFDLYESDQKIIPFLKKNIESCKKKLALTNIQITFNVIDQDFIDCNSHYLLGECSEKNNFEIYDVVIANPPYYKFSQTERQDPNKGDAIAKMPNIYPVFMLLGAKLLKNGGELVFLTPRSFCSGSYYKEFRNNFINIIKPKKIHLFEHRNEIFKKYKVIQENIIFHGKKTQTISEFVEISISGRNGLLNGDIQENNSPYSNVVYRKNNDIIIRVPTNPFFESIIQIVDNFEYNLLENGMAVSTGSIVPNRSKKYLIEKYKKKTGVIPLFWIHNIIDGTVLWPIKSKKPEAIVESPNIQKTKNQDLILVKRISSREGKKRLSAGIYLAHLFDFKNIAIENHVNYIYKKNSKFTTYELQGLSALLNSKIYNSYFLTYNGNTQVNADDLKKIPLPKITIIKKIGRTISDKKIDNEIEKEKIICDVLGIKKEIVEQLITF